VLVALTTRTATAATGPASHIMHMAEVARGPIFGLAPDAHLPATLQAVRILLERHLKRAFLLAVV